MAEEARDQNDQEAFFEELDSFQLHMPGGKTVDFCETDVLLNMVQKQYPRWKEMGSVTSIPTARVPRLFLDNEQMTLELEKTFESLQRGDGAEKNLYRLFVEGSFQKQPGLLIFPNLDGSLIFKTKIAKVEIDMVLIHQSKGIFVFNVKNEKKGKKGTSESKMKKDIEKHNKFIHMLMMYKNGTRTQEIPIHTVVCNFADSREKFFNLEQGSENEANKTLVFNKDSLNSEVFSKALIDKIEFVGIEDVVWDSRLETLVARLVALNSAEGALSLIHNQMTRNLLQSVSKQEHLEAQMSTSDQKNEQFKRMVVEHSETAGQKGKKKFILWTKDQMSIISRVYEHLTDPSSKKGLRLLITGCKGSGKTMLLTFIANLSLSLLKLQCEENLKGKTLVCDGSFRYPLLEAPLRSALISTDITFYAAPKVPTRRHNTDTIETCINPRVLQVRGRDFYLLKAFDKDSFALLRQDFSKQLENAKILLCDEFWQENHDYLLGDLRDDQHCVLFSSRKDYMGSEYDGIHLGASLRSTCRIAEFAHSWFKAADLGPLEFECKPAHNFEGENIIFTFVKYVSSDSIENRNKFVAECVKVISEHAEKSTGLEVIPVVSLVDSETKKLILENLKENGYTCYEPSFEINNDDSEGNIPRQDAGKHTSADSPSIAFFEKRDIEGAEFGTVLILIRFEEASHIPIELENAFFTAITRATIKVAIVLDHVASFKEPSHYESHKEVTGVLQYFLSMASEKRNTKTSIIIVGTNPNIPGFRRQDSESCEQVPGIEGISLHVGPQGSFLHIDDVYKESDLQKLLNYGIQIVIVFTGSRSPWQHAFYGSSYISFQHFSEKNRNCFHVENLATAPEYNIGNLTKVVFFCAEQSGISGVVKPDKPRQTDHHELPAPEGDIFSWDKWNAKGTEHHRLEQYNQAADRYSDSLVLLERHYNELISQSEINLRAAIQDRIKLAKLCTNVALMFIKHCEDPSKDQMDIYGRFRYQREHASLFETYMIPSFEHAVRAIDWNASCERGFERAKTVISRMREHYSEKKSSFGQTKNATLENIITEEQSKNVDPCFAQYRKTKALPLPTLSQAKLEKLDRMIADYEKEVQSLTFTQLIKLREQISGFAKSLAQESLGLVPKHLAGTEINFWDIRKNRLEARQVFDYPILLVIEALYWNPLEKDCYGILHQALERLEKVVEYLERNAKSLGQQRYLEQITQYKIENYSRPQLLF